MTAETDKPGDSEGKRRKPKRQVSLARRLMTVATVWSMLALAVAGIVLAGLYRAASERAFDAQLGVYLKTIVANMVPDGNVAGDSDAEGDLVRKPQGLGEPRFDLPFSGWYWTVIDHASNEVLFASPSLVGDMLQVGQGDRQEPDTSYFAIGPAEQEVRVRRLTVEINGNNYDIIVAAETDDFREDVRQFRRLVLLTMVILGAGLLGAIYLQVRVGLKPLKRLGGSLIEVRRGLAEKIDEDLPGELAPLAVELNALIHANREVVERSRTHVGNLAHALKTPLSVITNEARSTEGEFADKVGEQATLMSTQIQHHLERARMAAQRRVIGVSCELTPVLERMVSAMSKIYRDKDVAFDMPDTDELSDLRFRGEQQDLEEMVGNLLDNACKWADLEVQISVAAVSQEESARALFEICVEDDGPGLSEDQRLEAVKRGKRLDETVPGTGLGLSIVADLAGVYGGEFELSRSDKGGLKATLLLPSV